LDEVEKTLFQPRIPIHPSWLTNKIQTSQTRRRGGSLVTCNFGSFLPLDETGGQIGGNKSIHNNNKRKQIRRKTKDKTESKFLINSMEVEVC